MTDPQGPLERPLPGKKEPLLRVLKRAAASAKRAPEKLAAKLDPLPIPVRVEAVFDLLDHDGLAAAVPAAAVRCALDPEIAQARHVALVLADRLLKLRASSGKGSEALEALKWIVFLPLARGAALQPRHYELLPLARFDEPRLLPLARECLAALPILERAHAIGASLRDHPPNEATALELFHLAASPEVAHILLESVAPARFDAVAAVVETYPDLRPIVALVRDARAKDLRSRSKKKKTAGKKKAAPKKKAKAKAKKKSGHGRGHGRGHGVGRGRPQRPTGEGRCGRAGCSRRGRNGR